MSKKHFNWYVPDNTISGIDTFEKLLFLGKATIRFFLRYWRHEEKEISQEIKVLKSYIDFLSSNDSIEKIEEYSKKYEMPTFPVIVEIKIESHRYRRPFDFASMIRAKDSTTCNVCGWCRYASKGSTVADHVLSSCNLLTAGEVEHQHMAFNAPCQIKFISDKKLKKVLEKIKANRRTAYDKKGAIGSTILGLTKAVTEADEKPTLPFARDEKHFQFKDEIVMYNVSDSEISENTSFVKGRVFKISKLDNCIHAVFTTRLGQNNLSSDYLREFSVEAGNYMHLSDYEYLLSHPDFAEVWSKALAYTDEKDEKTFLKALEKERENRIKQKKE